VKPDAQKQTHANANGIENTNLPQNKLLAELRKTEEDFRIELSRREIDRWLELLKHPARFSAEEIIHALGDLVMYPADGWNGPPRRADVIRQILKNRESKNDDIARQGGRSLADEDCPMCRGTSVTAQNWRILDIEHEPESNRRREGA